MDACPINISTTRSGNLIRQILGCKVTFIPILIARSADNYCSPFHSILLHPVSLSSSFQLSSHQVEDISLLFSCKYCLIHHRLSYTSTPPTFFLIVIFPLFLSPLLTSVSPLRPFLSTPFSRILFGNASSHTFPIVFTDHCKFQGQLPPTLCSATTRSKGKGNMYILNQGSQYTLPKNSEGWRLSNVLHFGESHSFQSQNHLCIT